MVARRGTLILASMLCLVLALGGCTQPTEGNGAGEGAGGPADAAEGQEDVPIATKPPVRIDARLNGTTEETYMTELDGQNVLVLDNGTTTVLHYDLRMWFGDLPGATDVTVSWHLDEQRPVDAEVVGTHTMHAAPVNTHAVLPVSIVAGEGSLGADTRLFVTVETERDLSATTSVIGIVFQ